MTYIMSNNKIQLGIFVQMINDKFDTIF